MATVFQSSSREYLRNILGNLSFEKYSEKYCRISKVQQKPIIFSEDHEFRNNSEFSEHRSSCSEISLRKTLPRQASYLLRIFLREISRAPFRGNKWLSSLELAARRAKLIGKTHVRTPQVRRFLSKRELVRKGSEKTAKSACPRRHAAPIRRPEKTLPTAQPRDRGRVPVGPDLSRLEATNLIPPPRAQTENPLPSRRC